MIDLVIDKLWDGAPAADVEPVTLRLALVDDALNVRVEAPFWGDPPPGAPVGPTWQLWEHEVVELFLLGDDDRYVELELGPHGHHLALRLHGVRNVVARDLPLRYRARILGDRWEGEAWLPCSELPEGPWRLNATAIHGVGESRRYLSWRPLPGPRPDFHQPSAFAPLERARRHDAR